MRSDNQNTVFLVDVSSLFFRAYYAISSHLSSPKGLPTNALYGLLSMTCKFIKEHKAKYILYCFDHEKPSFRTHIYPQYKAQRKETPEDLKVQIPYIKQLVSALGIPFVEKEGYEADDLIGTFSQLAQACNFKVVIVSGDKDFAQLVSPAISLYDPVKNISYDPLGVEKKWGVKPQQINDYLALVGDASDNIPGVRGIGPKGAGALLKAYQNLDNIYKNLKIIPKKTAEKLKNSQEQAFLSQKLARIVTDIKEITPVSAQTKVNFERKAFQTEKLRALLQELGFKSFIEKLCPEGASSDLLNEGTAGKAQETGSVVLPKPSAMAPSPAVGVSSLKSVPSKEIKSRHLIGGDKRLSSNLKLNKMSYKEFQSFLQPYGKVWVFSHQGQYFFAFKNKVIKVQDRPIEDIGSFFADMKIKWLGYDLKKIWTNFKCTHPLPDWCAMIAGYLVEGGPPGDFQELCLKYTQEKPTAELEPGEIYRLHKNLKKQLEKKLQEMNMTQLYEDVERPLISVLYEMETQGITLDPGILKEQAKALQQKIQEIEKEVFSYTKHTFNIASPKQLADVLFTELNLPPPKKTKTGYSTDVQALSKLKGKHLVIPLILQHRELFKLNTTYVSALPPLIDKGTGRVHTCFLQALTATGRLSSRNPNLQNIPIKTERGQQIRKAFIAPEGKKIVSADYSQIELRILAHITQDPALCQAFEKDQDIHKATASEMYSVPLEEVSSQLRYSAKAINFGLIYGQGPWALSESLGISLAEAKALIKSYFEKFKGVREYMDSVVKRAHQQGYVETLFHRRRFISALDSSHFQTKKWSERVAINSPIQGTASDIVKMAMIKLRDSLYSPLLLQIHDELLFECEDHLLEEEIKQIQHIMENIVDWKVPLKVNIHVGQNWHLAHS